MPPRPRAVPARLKRSKACPTLEPLLLDYIRVRAHDPEPAPFVGVQGRRLSQTIMTQTLLRYARASGVTERKRSASDPGAVRAQSAFAARRGSSSRDNSGNTRAFRSRSLKRSDRRQIPL